MDQRRRLRNFGKFADFPKTWRVFSQTLVKFAVWESLGRWESDLAGKVGMRRGQNFEKIGNFGFLTVVIGGCSPKMAILRLDLTKIPYGGA